MDDLSRTTVMARGSIIEDIEITVEDELQLSFTDGEKLWIFDTGKTWENEKIYMHTDDNLKPFIGGVFISAEFRAGPTTKTRWGSREKESEFLTITTSKGGFTVVNYNEHNGCYGGFDIDASYSGIGDE